jgi:adenylate cyclase
LRFQEKIAERSASGAEPRIRFRIGINVGAIIIDGDDIFGDGVNVAARVENECEPGGVYVSGNVFEQIRGKTRLLCVSVTLVFAPLFVDSLAFVRNRT